MVRSIEKRLSDLERLVNSIVKKIDNNKFYTDSDISAHDVSITENQEECNNLEDAVCELSESTEESVAALEQALCDLSEEIGGQ